MRFLPPLVLYPADAVSTSWGVGALGDGNGPFAEEFVQRHQVSHFSFAQLVVRDGHALKKLIQPIEENFAPGQPHAKAARMSARRARAWTRCSRCWCMFLSEAPEDDRKHCARALPACSQ